ncbi:Glycolipid transfer protein domain-containing protein [Strongyloides ratti]|uniref:Glycolipid transfer protein domain-containing protein n=1 Tax=Strongyloides ratti TaxID=34506 RepID=A0A090LD05_STRRB|nr:Glycolipid transfer protein domain-containing protein [Strongyloides ratti]CEF67656.1 Glycolipid transfer protein domain-containing protein [Strongyloides ratti]
MDEDNKSFDLTRVTKIFTDSLKDETDVFLKQYLNAYEELSKIFTMLGRIFGFVESDVVNKLNILSTCLENKPENYNAVLTMIQYECSGNNKPLDQGSRTLLRLHRALDFIIKFVNGLMEGHCSGISIHEIVKKAYDETLANFHGFIIRKSVGLAVYGLPDREQILRRFFKIPESEEIPTEKIINEAEEFHSVANEVYSRIQIAYETRNLLNLP